MELSPGPDALGYFHFVRGLSPGFHGGNDDCDYRLLPGAGDRVFLGPSPRVVCVKRGYAGKRSQKEVKAPWAKAQGALTSLVWNRGSAAGGGIAVAIAATAATTAVVTAVAALAAAAIAAAAPAAVAAAAPDDDQKDDDPAAVAAAKAVIAHKGNLL